MKISIEGPRIPDVRDESKAEEAALNLLIDKAGNEWKKVSHRGTDLKLCNTQITSSENLALRLLVMDFTF